MPPRKIPQRKCVACQQMNFKKKLIRIVRSPEGEMSVDLSGKKPGRGAYLCQNNRCLQLAKKSKSFERTFNTSLAPEIYNSLENNLGHTGD